MVALADELGCPAFASMTTAEGGDRNATVKYIETQSRYCCIREKT
jgi:hypothetical protein